MVAGAGGRPRDPGSLCGEPLRRRDRSDVTLNPAKEVGASRVVQGRDGDRLPLLEPGGKLVHQEVSRPSRVGLATRDARRIDGLGRW
jgi:hypothetical protein